ncbi:MAG: type II toxin-antitoxin system prevent-host-death family antitoxin [Alphaproteobacteria bacterium]
MTTSVSASEFSRNFGRYKDLATADRVVEVSSNGRPVGAFLSQAEYDRYLRLRARETRNVRIEDLPEDLITGLERAEYGVAEK